MGADLHLYTHPDLQATVCERGGAHLILLGYALDPDAPDDADADIAARLAQVADTPEALFEQTVRLGGRWVIMAVGPRRQVLFHDPGGLRSVVYMRDAAGLVWCASQPELLRRARPLAGDADAQHAFLESPYMAHEPEAWWPGDRTPYAGVRHLLPNHALDLHRGATWRYWPRVPRPSLSFEDGAAAGADLLRRLFDAAARRQPLAVAMTAGLDSRLLLAAARSLVPTARFFTHDYYTIDARHPDARIPQRLADTFGLRYQWIDAESPRAFFASEDPRIGTFREAYSASVTTATTARAPAAYALSEALPPESLHVKGNMSEITRRYYARFVNPDVVPLDGSALATLTGMGDNAFAARHFQAWRDAAAGPLREAGYDLLDVFFWEQRIGRWEAQDQAEMDFALDAFTPFNCRALLETLLAVAPQHRGQPSEALHLALIERLWPEVMTVPVNPPTLRKRVARLVRPVLRHAGVRRWARWLRLRLAQR